MRVLMVDGDAGRRAPAPATSPAAEEAEFLWELRKYVLLLATLAATVTYTAGLDPPGGFWTDNVGELLAGDPVLQKTYPRRYKAFFYCNATAFVASLVIVNLLLVRFLCRRRWWLRALQAAMILDMFGLMGAYAAGSSREAAMSAYILVLVILVCSYVSAHVLLYGLTAQVSGPDAPERVERARKYLLIFATLAATVAYQAGLSTPGGFWLGSLENQHLAGDPMLRGNHPYRFMVFFYFNTTAFVASLVTIMLLMSRTVSRHGFRSSALWVCVGAAMVGLMGAFAAGSCRSFKTSIYVIALVGAVLLYIAIQAMVFFSEPVKDWLHRAGETLQKCLKLDELEQRNQQQITLSNQGNGDAYLLLKKSRMYLLLLGILAASVFFYCNATSFMASLVIMVLLLIKRVSNTQPALLALHAAMILDLFGLMGVYAAGSCRRVTTSAYILALLVGVSAYIVVLVVVSVGVARWMKKSCRISMIPKNRITSWNSPVAFAAGSCRKVKTSVYVFVLVLAVLLCIAFQVALVVSGSLRRLVNSLLSKLGAPLEEDAGERLPHTAADEPRDLWDEKLPKYLLLLAALAAAVTYQAAMSPPGGLWDDGQTEHIVGDPVLLTNYARRYKAFFYCNATSFMASLVIMVLLLIKRVSNTQPALLALHAAMILDLFGLMGAYAAGSCRRVTTSAYILALLVGVSAYIVVLVVVSIGVARWMKKVMDKVGEKLTHCFSFEDL
uniref:PGG domain-containing protein n=1 Tax=Oryza nivara TaxID=4536 RepID=A0A0E0HKU8_ORYNI